MNYHVRVPSLNNMRVVPERLLSKQLFPAAVAAMSYVTILENTRNIFYKKR